MKEIKALIKDRISEQREEYISLLQKMISFDSKIIEAGKFGQEEDIQSFIAEYFLALGAEVDIFEPDNSKISKYKGFNAGHQYSGRNNVVAKFSGIGGGKSLLLNGHCDIVPEGSIEKWSFPPFAGEIHEGRIFGRGATDMKGGTAAAICAIKLLLDLGCQFKGDIIVESVVDEEGGGNGTIACCDKGYRADGALIMEPTSLAVMTCNRGAFLAEFVVTGKPIHAAMKGKGQNAIEKAIKLINALHDLESFWLMTKKHNLLSNPTINIGTISGGDGASTAAGTCKVQFDVEFLPSEMDDEYKKRITSPEEIKSEVEEMIALTCAGDQWLSKHPVQVNWYQETLCFETNEDDPFAITTMKSVKDVLGTVHLDGLPCGCDGAQLAHIGRMPVIILGPGELSKLHIIDESVSIEKFLNAIEIYANLIINWVEIGGMRNEKC